MQRKYRPKLTGSQYFAVQIVETYKIFKNEALNFIDSPLAGGCPLRGNRLRHVPERRLFILHRCFEL